jgi:hypothetical protein
VIQKSQFWPLCALGPYASVNFNCTLVCWPTFPLNCAAAHPRTLNCCHAAGIFLCKYSYYVYYKKILKCPAVVRSCQNFMLRAVAGPRSCKKKIEGALMLTYFPQIIQYRSSSSETSSCSLCSAGWSNEAWCRWMATPAGKAQNLHTVYKYVLKLHSKTSRWCAIFCTKTDRIGNENSKLEIRLLEVHLFRNINSSRLSIVGILPTNSFLFYTLEEK